MTLTIIPIGLELLNFMIIWQSMAEVPLTLLGKIVLSIAFVEKLACYFWGALVVGIDNPKLRNVLLAVCVLINVCIVLFSVITGVWMLLVNNVIILALFIVWLFAFVDVM